jgi:putative flippase GtrA
MRQIIRYGVVGLASNLIIYMAYLLMTRLGVGPKLAMSITYLSGALIGYFGNRQWAFAHRGNAWRAAMRYALAHSMGYLLNFLILLLLVDHLGYAQQWVQALAIIIVAGFLFIVFKFFVFGEKFNHCGTA